MKATIKLFATVFMACSLLAWPGCIDRDPLFDGDSCMEDCIVFEGFVTDPNNNVPVPSEITIEHITSQSIIPRLQTIGKFDTDANGYFEFSFDGTNYADGAGYFEISAVQEGYLTTENDGRTVTSIVDSTFFDSPINANIELRPEAALEVRLSIADPASLSGWFTYQYKYGATKYGVT
ncbi:MAG: hypothetical protein AAGI38_03505 [Bacteroidota bacterium]